MSSWPPRFKITPDGAAAMFILSNGLGNVAGRKEQLKLGGLLKYYADEGYKKGYEAALKEAGKCQRYDVDYAKEMTPWNGEVWGQGEWVKWADIQEAGK